KPQHGQDEINLIEAMKSHYWNFSGFDHSYWDFYFGYGLLAILYGVVEIVLLLLLSSLSKTNSFKLRPVIAVFIFANILHAILILNYFFLLPAIFDLIISLVLGAAFFVARKSVDALVV
ncbi:MAG TPA: hypothetical protein VKC90_16640, partial [Chitinophagaceae bacterium]|nr:hypothetical protein [Chitinophagaceae bacterium]